MTSCSNKSHCRRINLSESFEPYSFVASNRRNHRLDTTRSIDRLTVQLPRILRETQRIESAKLSQRRKDSRVARDLYYRVDRSRVSKLEYHLPSRVYCIPLPVDFSCSNRTEPGDIPFSARRRSISALKAGKSGTSCSAESIRELIRDAS